MTQIDLKCIVIDFYWFQTCHIVQEQIPQRSLTFSCLNKLKHLTINQGYIQTDQKVGLRFINELLCRLRRHQRTSTKTINVLQRKSSTYDQENHQLTTI